jgi:DNA polymerase-3 subunit epsilon
VRSPLQGGTQAAEIRRFAPKRTRLPVIAPSAEELAAHERWLDDLEKQSNGQCLWKRLSN